MLKCKIRRQKGAILIVSFWVLLILSMLVIGLGHKLSLEIRLTHNHLDSLKAVYIAKAGIQRALAERLKALRSQSGIDADAFNKSWFNNKEIFKNVKLGEGAYTVENFQMPGLYGMCDEQCKININTASDDVLRALIGPVSLKQGGADAKRITASIRAWRGDSDGGTLSILRTEDEAYYQAQNPPYRCKGSEFAAIEEILLIRGITPELFYGKDGDGDSIIGPEEEGFGKYITIYGNGAVNINTAPRPVLEAVLDAEIADYIDNFRLWPEGRIGSSWFVAQGLSADTSDYKIKNIYDVEPDPALGTDLTRNYLWKKLQTAKQNNVIGVKSSGFRINGAAEVKGIKKSIEAVAVFDENTDIYKFKYWHQKNA